MRDCPIYDAVIIGGGIAGCCAAIALARRGFRVSLLEAGEFPRHKVCGEFLSPDGRRVLDRLGATEAVLAAGAVPVAAARVIAGSGQAVEMLLPPGGVSLSRYRLDHALWSAARHAGVECRQGARVRGAARAQGDGGESFAISSGTGGPRSRVVLDASGRQPISGRNGPRLQSSTPSAVQHIGLKTHFRGVDLEPGVVELHGWHGGYCGVVRIEGGLANICLLARYENLRERSKASPEALWAWVLQQCPTLARRLRPARPVMPWLSTGNVTFTAPRPAGDGVLRIGDAAGFIHPLTGDGMAMAARGGELAAAVAAARLEGRLTPHDAEVLYTAAYRREFAGRLRWGRWLQVLLTEPRLTAPAVTVLARNPRLARLAVARTRGR